MYKSHINPYYCHNSNQNIYFIYLYFLKYFPSRNVITHKYNVSVNNTTIYFIYNKNSILSGRHVSTFTGSSLGSLRNISKNYLYINALRDPKCLQIVLHKYKTHSCNIIYCRNIKIHSCNIIYFRHVKYIPLV